MSLNGLSQKLGCCYFVKNNQDGRSVFCFFKLELQKHFLTECRNPIFSWVAQTSSAGTPTPIYDIKVVCIRLAKKYGTYFAGTHPSLQYLPFMELLLCMGWTKHMGYVLRWHIFCRKPVWSVLKSSSGNQTCVFSAKLNKCVLWSYYLTCTLFVQLVCTSNWRVSIK